MTTQSLGYYDLMNIAEQNSEQSAKKAAQLKFPSFKPGSKNVKVDTKAKALSENVKKFLAKKDEEKRQADEEARRKRQNLLDLRSRDKKATRRVGQMLRMTKSANKSAIADAVNCLSDSLVEQGDVHQPDEDDYGYVSKSAEEWHKKMMDKYKTIPKSKPVPRSETHQEVKVPESKPLKEGKMGQSDSRCPIPSSHNGSGISKKQQEVKKAPAQKPLSYVELMAIADEKRKNPDLLKLSMVPQPQTNRNKDTFEFGRPMTAQEKAVYVAEKALKDKVAKSIKDGTFRITPAKEDTNNNRPSKGKISVTAKEPVFKIPSKKAASLTTSPVLRTALASSQSSSPERRGSVQKPDPRVSDKRRRSPSPLPQKKVVRPEGGPSRDSKVARRDPDLNRGRLETEKKNPALGPSSTARMARHGRESNPEAPKSHKEVPAPVRERQLPLTKTFKVPASFRQNQKRPSQESPARIPSDYDAGPRYAPPTRDRDHNRMPKPSKGRQVIDSEEDYDSDMDDFIDDSEADPNQISEMIRSITGYDKRRFRDDSDDECMETSAYDQMREENRSLRIGIKEDLEDMRLEAEEKKRKAERDKLKRKQGR